MSERRHWCQNGKPLVVMDEPTEEHIKALMMTWVRRDPKHVMLSELTPDKRDAIGHRVGSPIASDMVMLQEQRGGVRGVRQLRLAAAGISAGGGGGSHPLHTEASLRRASLIPLHRMTRRLVWRKRILDQSVLMIGGFILILLK